MSIFRAIALGILLLISFEGSVLAEENCEAMLSRELPRLVEMPHKAFDQDADGWRLLSKQGCFREAASAIESFAAAKAAPYNVYFHGAQMHATVGNNMRARELLKLAIRPEMPEDSPFRWNAYVRAVDAFLAGDLSRLRDERAVIADRADVRGNQMNLAVVDRLISNFGRPYGDIFK
jgi:hypothetical protein